MTCKLLVSRRPDIVLSCLLNLAQVACNAYKCEMHLQGGVELAFFTCRFVSLASYLVLSVVVLYMYIQCAGRIYHCFRGLIDSFRREAVVGDKLPCAFFYKSP